MSRRCVILAGGEIGSELQGIQENDYLICADRGYLAAERAGAEPDMVIGDFDSLGYVPRCGNLKIYPSGKDDTDTMLAVKHALSIGADEIHIYGALGGRIDHTLANIQTLAYIAQNGGEGMLIGENERLSLQTAGTVKRYRRRYGWYFSIFAFSERCEGVSLTGTEYPLENALLENSFPLGVSNHITGEYAELSVGRGCIFVAEVREV